MRLEILGGGSLLIAGSDTSLLLNPLLGERHSDGRFAPYPPRQLDVTQMPLCGAVLLSGVDPSRLDLESLARIPRATPILAPDSRLALGSLEGLGFATIEVIDDWRPVEAGSLEVIATPGPGPTSHGFILRGEGLTLWHLARALPDAATIDEVHRRFGDVDLLVAPLHRPQGDPRGSADPVEDHRRALATIRAIGPGALIPDGISAATGPFASANHRLFPISRERAHLDLAALDPQLASRLFVVDPGDALVISEGVVARERGLLRYCARLADHEPAYLELRPRPAASPRDLPEGLTTERFTAVLADILDAVVSAADDDPRAFAEHRRWHARWRYDVILADESRLTRTIDLCARGDAIDPENSPGASACAAITAIHAASLVDLLSGAASWSTLVAAGEVAVEEHLYRIDEAGLHAAPEPLVDPLALAFAGAEAREQNLARVVERLLADEHVSEDMGSSRDKDAPQVDSAAIMRGINEALQSAGLDGNVADAIAWPPEASDEGGGYEE